MAVSVHTFAPSPPVSSSSVRKIEKLRESSSFLSYSRKPLSYSSLCHGRFPFLFYSATPSRYHRNGCSVVGSLPPSRNTTNTASASTKLYVSGLSFRTTEESLRNAFENFGDLVEVNLVMDRIANRPRGFAFLRYSTQEESQKAIEGMHGKFLDGRVIFVEVAKPRTELRRQGQQTPRQY